MQVIQGIEAFQALNIDGTAVTVGSFDGVHGGHSSLLATLKERAHEQNLKSVVVSFTPHPRVALGRTEGFSLLTSDEEKAALLEEAGIDILLLLNFDATFSALSAEQFIIDHLIKGLNMRELIVGFNHHMGSDRGSFEQIAECAQKHNLNITQAQEYSQTDDNVSSTSIRAALNRGDIDTANRLLAHPYTIIGYSNAAGCVELTERLKLIPPQGRYKALINNKEQVVDIDSEGRIWLKEREKRVEIKLIKSYEK